VFGPAIQAEASGIPIGLEEAYEYYFIAFKDKTLWIDLRDGQLYNQGHIAGAVNIPLYVLKDKLNLVPKDRHLVLYCQDTDCDLGKTGSEVLIENGFSRGKIRVFSGGIKQWRSAGYPVEKKA
jgi:rhodanese-related sulfurtransferase